jgi:peptidyl-prolyl cis-trans isomerase B (cyclophilin B)
MNQTNGTKGVVKTVLIFTTVLALISLIYMLLSAYFENKSKMYIDIDTMELVQLDDPQEGDPIAVIDTTIGQMSMVLYPEYSPNAVQNFIELAEEGYYDNTYVFHSEEGAYSAAGAKNKDGTMPDGYDTERELVERELNQNLWPFRGAVFSMTTTVKQSFFQRFTGDGTYYCGSRFGIINSIEFTDEIEEQLRSYSGSEELADAFIEKGGIPNFSQQITIIGQIYDGLDVVDELANLDTNNSDDDVYKIPQDDIMILSVTIDEYHADTNENNENLDS